MYNEGVKQHKPQVLLCIKKKTFEKDINLKTLKIRTGHKNTTKRLTKFYI